MEEAKIADSTSSPRDRLREQVQKLTHRDRWVKKKVQKLTHRDSWVKGAGAETYTQKYMGKGSRCRNLHTKMM